MGLNMTIKQVRLLRALGVDFANPFAENIKYALDNGYLQVAETVSPKVRLQINKTVDKAYKELMNKPPEVAYKKLSEQIRKKKLSSGNADAERAIALYKLNHNAMKHKNKRIADIGK